MIYRDPIYNHLLHDPLRIKSVILQVRIPDVPIYLIAKGYIIPYQPKHSFYTEQFQNFQAVSRLRV